MSTFMYNAFGQLTTSTDGTLLTTYTYDGNGNQTAGKRGTRLARISVWCSSVPMLTGLRQLQ